MPEYKLTHLVFTSGGSPMKNEDDLKNWMKAELGSKGKAAEKIGLPIVSVYSNLKQFYPYPHTTLSDFGTLNLCSYILALQKLFKVYYHSSGQYIGGFDIHSVHDLSKNDVFNLKCLSNENVCFYSAGAEKTRFEKVEYIANDPIVQKNLDVCMASTSVPNINSGKKLNCGICAKCMRTICELYALDKLDAFEDIFNTTAFRKNKQKFIAKMRCMNIASYFADIIKKLKKQSKIGVSFYFWVGIYRPVYFIKKYLKNSVFLRKLYYTFKLDIFIDGFRNEDLYEAFKMKNEK